ncbi:MAG: ISAs1 family transposase, partial [Duodenibacillus sp.]|nr:ISAs1 family transposase [Duodenibacillus sp.]
VTDEATGKRRSQRISVGHIKDGKFTFSELYQLRSEVEKLREHVKVLEAARESGLPEEKAGVLVKAAGGVEKRICEAIEKTELDGRNERRTVPLSSIAAAAILSSLAGNSDSVRIEDYLKTNHRFFEAYMPGSAIEAVSHDTVRRSLMLTRTDKFMNFYAAMTEGLVRSAQNHVLAADGQAVRATGRSSADAPGVKGARMMMNVFDTNNRVCVAQRIINKKTNEISVGYQMIEDLDIAGSVVTADAMNCQVGFVTSVISGGADYLISLKGNQDRSWKEAMHQFGRADESNIIERTYGPDLDHGRIEARTVSILPGRFLQADIWRKWPQLAGGSIVRVRRTIEVKSTGRRTDEFSYYITSLPPFDCTADRIYEAVRGHWSVENNLHWVLDVHWGQDRMQAKDPRYISNRSALNKLALALLENYRFWLWSKDAISSPDELSIKTLQARCGKPEVALECLAAGLGII